MADKVATHAAQDHGVPEVTPELAAKVKARSGTSKIETMIVGAAESSDEALAARAATGDDAAFETLVVRYQHRVFRLACRLASETDAPDIMQDAFLQVYRQLRHSAVARSSALALPDRHQRWTDASPHSCAPARRIA